METATPLNSGLIEKTLNPRPESHVIDDTVLYEELIAPHEAAMMRSIWRVVRDRDLAEDCLQNALTLIWKKRAQIRKHPNPKALILKICLNTAIDGLRRLQRIRCQTDLSQLENAPASSESDPDRELDERELEEQVQRAIARLPRKRALAVMMRLIHDESFESIAHALDCNQITVRIHISRGRAQLRKLLSPLYPYSRQEAGDE